MSILFSPQLQAFIAITENHTVHAAARKLCITQTAVTQRLKNLESKLGVSVFVRKKSGMVLTHEGEALVRYCQITQASEKQTLAEISGSGRIAPVQLTICGPSSLMNSRIIPSTQAVIKQFPRLLLNFKVDDRENRHEQLKSGACDLAVIQSSAIQAEFNSKWLAPEEYILVATADWAERSLTDILENERIIDFDPDDQLTFNYLSDFNLMQYAQSERFFANQTQSILQLIRAGAGYGLLTVEFCQSYLHQQELVVLNAGKIYTDHYALAWYPRPETPDYLIRLIDAIQ